MCGIFNPAMRKPTEQDLIAVFTRAAFELSVCVENGTLEMPAGFAVLWERTGNSEAIANAW
jgi:hypothetical protein